MAIGLMALTIALDRRDLHDLEADAQRIAVRIAACESSESALSTTVADSFQTIRDLEAEIRVHIMDRNRAQAQAARCRADAADEAAGWMATVGELEAELQRTRAELAARPGGGYLIRGWYPGGEVVSCWCDARPHAAGLEVEAIGE